MARAARTCRGRANGAHADTATAVVRVDHHVLDERVNTSVPEHVDEPDESIAIPGHDPPEAVAGGLGDPVPLRLTEDAGLECDRVERVDLAVRERSAPRVGDVAVRH